MEKLDAYFTPRHVSLSLPSLRINRKVGRIPEMLSKVRKAGLTLAPEVARGRMRTMIGKPIRDVDLLEAAGDAWKRGWDIV